MTADTFSNTLGYLVMGTGNDNNSWGSNANTAVFQIFEDAIANVLTSAVTGGTLDLSGSPPPAAASQVRYAALIFTGTLASNQILKVPNLTKFWWINNQTSGAFTLKIQTPSGSASGDIPQNSGYQLVYCDGSNNLVVSPFNFNQVQMPDGSTAAPSYSFDNETNTGFRRAGTQDLRLVVDGADIMQFTGTGAGSPSIVNVLTPNALQVNGVNVATGTAVTASGTPTTGHLATWASATQIQDGGAAGALANISTLTSQYLDATNNTTQGMNMPLNLQLAASVGSNLLTVTMKTAAGGTPSSSSPVLINFPDATAANGDPVNVSVTGALSISTNATGATLGSTNGNSFRLWVAVFNNAGTPVLALINCSTSAGTFPIPVTGIASTTAISGSATSAGVFYTPNGTTLSNCAYRLIGFLSYETALVTAGTYNNAPDNVRLFGPGVPRPGEIVQTVFATQSTASVTLGSSFTQTNTSAAITPTSKANLVLARAIGGSGHTASIATIIQLSRGAGPTLIGGIASDWHSSTGTSEQFATTLTVEALDLPQTTSSVTYYVYGKGGGANVWLGTISSTVAYTSTITLQEIMG